MAGRVYPNELPQPIAILGWDGTDFRVLLVDADHHLQVDTLSNVLADGAALEATLANLQDNVGSRTAPAAGTVNAQLADLVGGLFPLGRARTLVKGWNVDIAAGATDPLLGTTAGKGYVRRVMLLLNGQAATAADSKVRITLDGTYVCDFEPSEALYINNGAVGNFADMDVFRYDTTEFEYWVHWRPNIPFLTSIKIDIVNNDTVNTTNVRVCVIYRSG